MRYCKGTNKKSAQSLFGCVRLKCVDRIFISSYIIIQ